MTNHKFPRLTPEGLSISGRVKVEPEDFIVEELPAYLPCGAGEHLYLWIQKRDVSADSLIGHLARSLGIRRDEIGLAGLKDRRALTRQWVSVPAAVEDRINSINTDQIQVLAARRHGNKLRSGHLRGNRFEIVIRDVPPGALQSAQRIAEGLASRGVPNYFGEQRFGVDGQTLELGLSLLFGETNSREIPAGKRKFLTRLALSAAQSSLFNAVLARRLTAGTLHRVQIGDVMQVLASGGLFSVEDAAVEQARFNRRETVITGPLFGPKMKAPTGAPWDLEQEVLLEAGLSMAVFAANKKLTPGGRRPLVIWPEELSVREEEHGLKLQMSLPSGAYATVVLQEFLHAFQ